MTTANAHQTATNDFYGGYNHWDEVSHPVHGNGFVANFGRRSTELFVSFEKGVKVVRIKDLALLKQIPVKIIENNKALYGGLRIGDIVVHEAHGTGSITGYSPFNKEEVGVLFRSKIKKTIKHQDLTIVGPTNKMFYQGKLRDLRGLPETY